MIMIKIKQGEQPTNDIITEEVKLTREEELKLYTDFDWVFSKEHLYLAARECCKGVIWKASVQEYRHSIFMNVFKVYEELHNGTYKALPFYKFKLYERGKRRIIRAVHIYDRTVQRCLCDYSLVPLLSRHFIYDNGACMKGKGVEFTIERFKKKLHAYYNKHGNKGWVLRFDFSKYFENINHKVLKEILHKEYADSPKIEKLLCSLIDMFGDKGMGLGSQISQICALAVPNKIDHYMTEVMHIEFYGRYMDDGYMICNSKEKLQECLIELQRLCNELGIILNPKKTQLIKLSRGVSFLKRKFILTSTGKVVQIPNKKNIILMHKKLKAFKKKLDDGTMTIKDIECSYISWKGHMKTMKAYFAVHKTDILYKRLFGDKSYNNMQNILEELDSILCFWENIEEDE